MVGIEPDEPEQRAEQQADVSPDHDDLPDHNVSPNPDQSADEIPSRRFDAWRRRSAVGGMATGIALGLQEVFYPNKNEPVISAEAPGEPPDADDRLRVVLDPDDPTKSTVVVPKSHPATPPHAD
jgi:hypothetical protein